MAFGAADGPPWHWQAASEPEPKVSHRDHRSEGSRRLGGPGPGRAPLPGRLVILILPVRDDSDDFHSGRLDSDPGGRAGAYLGCHGRHVNDSESVRVTVGAGAQNQTFKPQPSGSASVAAGSHESRKRPGPGPV